MKKIFIMLLAFSLCLSMVACEKDNQEVPSTQTTTIADKKEETTVESNGENTSPETDENNDENALNLYQEWKAVSDGQTARFDEEGNFYIDGGIYKYTYDKKASALLVNVGVELCLPVSLVDGIYRIDIDGTEFVPASNYQELHEIYAKTHLIIPDLNGDPCLNSALVGEVLERVELTLENWRNYIHVYSYEWSRVVRDPFGEIIDTYTGTETCLGYGVDRYHEFDAVVELKHKETGELTIYILQFGAEILDSPIDLEEYECTRIKGHLYFIDIPEELIREHDNGASFLIGDAWSNTLVSLSTFSKVVQHGGYSWDNYLD